MNVRHLVFGLLATTPSAATSATFERLVEDDLKQAAIVLAWTADTVANREKPIPPKR